MADDKQNALWPIAKSFFKVTLGDKGTLFFLEVSGLDSEYDMIEYRNVKMPGIRKAGDVTLKKGTFFKDNMALLDYLNEFKTNTIARQTATIQLLDQGHIPVFTWTLKNAVPMKITSIDHNAQNSEVTIEEMVLFHDGLSAEKA